MRQAFTLPASGAVARRLAMLSEISDLALDDATRAMCGQDLIAEDAFGALALALDEDQRSAVQNLCDLGLRGVLATDDFEAARDTILAAACISGVRPIIVVSNTLSAWNGGALGLGLSIGTDPDEDVDLLVVAPDSLVSQETLRRRRGGLLVLDMSVEMFSAQMMSGPAREVEKTIIICDFQRELKVQGDVWGRACHMTLVRALQIFFSDDRLTLIDPFSPSVIDLRERGFKKTRPAELYPLFNTVFDLLGEAKPS